MGEVSVITLKDVTFSYNHIPVLENVHFNIYKGDFLSVVGPNGGGKTTLLKIILGLLKPNRGEVEVLGRSAEKSRGKIGYMPQYTLFDPQFPVTVMDVVLMGRLGIRRGGPYSKSDRKAALEALEEVELTHLLKRSLSDISGGQRQRVLLARALISKPQILLLDEPTSNVDMEIENKLYSILQELTQRGMTILMVTHDLGFVSKIVKSCICVNREVVVHPTSEINGKVIQEVYGRDLRMVRHDRISDQKGEVHG